MQLLCKIKSLEFNVYFQCFEKIDKPKMIGSHDFAGRWNFDTPSQGDMSWK
jgi:hypothetical protein